MEKRLVFIVEGDCEIEFVNKIIIPYLYRNPASAGWSINAQKITTNRRLNAKSGIISFEYLKNEINRVESQGVGYITTFLDFFRIPTSFPGFTKDSNKIEDVENAIVKWFSYGNIIPYIQKHEFEAVLFSNLEAFELLLDDETQIDKIKAIMDDYPNSEDINGGEETAPSKRLASIFNYKKVLHSAMLLDYIGIEDITARCPRLKIWLNKLESIF